MTASERLRAFLGPRLTPAQKRTLNRLRALGHAGDLARLASVFGSDKEGGHHYTEHYDRHFRHLRGSRLNILEIGIGGYDDPEVGGGSLRMWKAYFPRARVFGIDIYDKSPHDEARIKTYCGSQVDEAFLRQVVDYIGTVDIVIDDGSHFNEHVVETFRILFPLLGDDGIYVVEDVQTSYWPDGEWGGSTDLGASHTSMALFKRLADGLNYEEYRIPGYAPSYTDSHVVGVHFYHNLVFIAKGTNNEGSNAAQA